MLIFAKILSMEPTNQPPQQNPYDFINNPIQPQKSPGFGANSLKTRLLVVGGGLLILIIIATVVGSFLTNSGKGDLPGLKNLVAEQQELIRIATVGTTKAIDPSVRALAVNTSLSTTTQQQKLIAYLDTRGVKLSKIELAANKSDAIDKELETAVSNNRFDEAFSKIIGSSLQAYNSNLNQAYKAAANTKSKTILEESFNNSVILLGIKPAE